MVLEFFNESETYVLLLLLTLHVHQIYNYHKLKIVSDLKLSFPVGVIFSKSTALGNYLDVCKNETTVPVFIAIQETSCSELMRLTDMIFIVFCQRWRSLAKRNKTYQALAMQAKLGSLKNLMGFEEN